MRTSSHLRMKPTLWNNALSPPMCVSMWILRQKDEFLWMEPGNSCFQRITIFVQRISINPEVEQNTSSRKLGTARIRCSYLYGYPLSISRQSSVCAHRLQSGRSLHPWVYRPEWLGRYGYLPWLRRSGIRLLCMGERWACRICRRQPSTVSLQRYEAVEKRQ